MTNHTEYDSAGYPHKVKEPSPQAPAESKCAWPGCGQPKQHPNHATFHTHTEDETCHTFIPFVDPNLPELCPECGRNDPHFHSELIPDKPVEADSAESPKPEPPRWISVEEKLPDFEASVEKWGASSREVLIFLWGHIHLGTAHVYKNGECVFTVAHIAGDISQDVTHWQPLPDPPKEKP